MPPSAPITPKGGVNHIQVPYLSVGDEVLGAAWNGSLQVPTKNAVYDAIAALNNASGTYTPTLTLGTNAAAATPYQTIYLRVGGSVLVVGQIDIRPTASATPTEVYISLPIAADLVSQLDLSGTLSATNVGQAGGFYADTANDRATARFLSTGTTNSFCSFAFSYKASSALTPLPFGSVSDLAYSALWDAVADKAPSQNAVYDALPKEGSYSPTYTVGTGVTSISPTNPVYWLRVGKTVQVWAHFNVTHTTGAPAAWRISLPIASTFTASGQCVGSLTCANRATSGMIYCVNGDTTVQCNSNIAASGTTTFAACFMYQIVP